MKKKLKFINLLMPMIVLFAILFPAVHSYEHIHAHNATVLQTTKQHSTNKSEFKLHNHSDQCAICHFKFAPVSTFSFVYFDFYKSNSLIPFVSFYFKSYSYFFKGALFALRAPPAII